MNNKKIGLIIVSALLITTIGQATICSLNASASETSSDIKTSTNTLATDTSITDDEDISKDSDFTFDVNTQTITDYHGNASIIKIPEKINGLTVKNISAIEAFFDDTDLFIKCSNPEKIKKVIIPANIEKIDRRSFSNCKNLEEVDFSEGLKYIGYEAFAHTSLKSVKLPNGIKSIDSNAFSYIDKLEEITIPDGIKTLDPSIADNDPNLERVTIPESTEFCYQISGLKPFNGSKFQKNNISSNNGFYCINNKLIGYYGNEETIRIPENMGTRIPSYFLESSTVKQLILNDNITEIDNKAFCPEPLGPLCSINKISGGNVKYIGDYAFDNCIYLSDIDFAKNAEKIGSHAFFNCIALKEANFSKNLKSIDDSAFFSCTLLEKVTIDNKNVKISNKAFDLAPNVKLYVEGKCIPLTDIDNITSHFGTATSTATSTATATVTATSTSNNGKNTADKSSIILITSALFASLALTINSLKRRLKF